MRSLQAIILAAGEGTRMKSDLPKILHPICGRPMIAYALHLAASAGAKQPIVVLGHNMEAVKAHLPKEVKVVVQSEQRGTGDAVIAAKRALGDASGHVLILYADTPLLRRTTVQKLIGAHFKTGATCSLLTAHLADPSGYGRVTRNENGQIDGIVEEAEAGLAQRAIREINVGPLICQGSVLVEALAALKPSKRKQELYLTDIVAYVARQEGTKLHSTRVEEIAEAFGVNSRADLARAIGVTRQRIIEMHLHNGVTIEDPHSTFIDHGVHIGADTVVHPATVIETGVSIGKRCSIGPFARLRHGVTISEGVRVGNFAELVRTKIGPRVRISHVSYLGDAIVEEDTNIGAGTVTANYDGTKKYQTHIGKRAFIGSDTILIAPVKVGSGAVTGAGSVVTKSHDVPPKGVVVGVPARPLTHGAGGPARPLNHRPSEGATSASARPPKVSVAVKRDGVAKPSVQRSAKRAALKTLKKTRRVSVASGRRKTAKIATRRVRVRVARRRSAVKSHVRSRRTQRPPRVASRRRWTANVNPAPARGGGVKRHVAVLRRRIARVGRGRKR